MSRIGKQPIPVPDGVTVVIDAGTVSVSGPKGRLDERISPQLTVVQEDGVVKVGRTDDSGDQRALHGLTRSLIANMVLNCANGCEKQLEIQGVGYRAAVKGKTLELSVGYSHPVEIDFPEGVEVDVPQPTQVIVRGVSKQAVGELAARIRKVRPPEPYKGKGIRYAGEHVQRKVGKRA